MGFATSELKHAASCFTRKAFIERNITADRCTGEVECVIGLNEE